MLAISICTIRVLRIIVRGSVLYRTAKNVQFCLRKLSSGSSTTPEIVTKK